MLSPAELFAARNREKTLPQRTHGQKDFLPDGSEAQIEKLRVCREEQWELLREERVERLGSLVRGIWRPKEALVELTSPAGKFWQTMGFTEQGKQCLLPEEAVYLLECGSVQLFYRDQPLSVQEAYERLLTDHTIPVLRYQVYSHLKRLGYIVTRFNPSSIQSNYQRQLNLESCRSRRKRKRSSSPRYKSKIKQDSRRHTEEKESHLTVDESISCSGNESTASKRDVASCEQDIKQDLQSDNQLKSRDHHAAVQSLSQFIGDQSEHMHLQTDDQSEKRELQLVDQSENTVTPRGSKTSRWDFTKILFPNCATDQPCTLLPEPEPALLPQNVTGREVDISCWLRKLNLRPDKMSRREQEQWDWERKYKSSVNADPKVKKCSNWREYKVLLQEREQQSKRERPPHLWASTVTPLLRPGHVYSTASVLEQITVMKTSHLLDGAESRLQSRDQIGPQIHFNVYQADGVAEFKKSKPGKPYIRLCVRRSDEQIPSLRVVKMLAYQSGDVPVVFAIVHNGEVAFYSFKDFQLPVDVYP
ncbi:tRNA-splicing endonuclease subunit Sen54 [Rhinophrynus dorsalis]